MLNVPKVGAIEFTVKMAVTLPLMNPPLAACVAVIVSLPIPTIVTVFPLIVAMEVLLLI